MRPTVLASFDNVQTIVLGARGFLRLDVPFPTTRQFRDCHMFSHHQTQSFIYFGSTVHVSRTGTGVGSHLFRMIVRESPGKHGNL